MLTNAWIIKSENFLHLQTERLLILATPYEKHFVGKNIK